MRKNVPATALAGGKGSRPFDVSCLRMCGAYDGMAEGRSFDQSRAREDDPLMGIDKAF